MKYTFFNLIDEDGKPVTIECSKKHDEEFEKYLKNVRAAGANFGKKLREAFGNE